MRTYRLNCDKCGLSATHFGIGDRGVTSFDAEQCELRCENGKAARAAGESVPECVERCAHLLAALERAKRPLSR